MSLAPFLSGCKRRDTINHFAAIFILLLPLLGTYASAEEVKDTPHYNVVNEYIRSLGAIHKIQRVATKEFQEDNDKDNQVTSKMMSAIRNSTRVKLELNASISALKGMKLKKPFETLLPTTISWYKHKIELHDEIMTISKILLNPAPKPGVDYSKIAARMPEITATLEYIDESIFQSMVLVFALLIDEKPDSQGHMSHLNITKVQRQTLIDNINSSFGESFDKENKNWTVSSGALLKSYLLKDYKCIEEW